MPSPVRRALGTKDANAALNMRSPIKSNVLDALRSPSPRTDRGNEQLASPSDSPREALKRKIDQVEDPERLDQEQPLFLSQKTELLSQSSSQAGDDQSVAGSTVDDSAHAFASTNSFSAGQDAGQSQEFELQQEEMSQRTLDKLHAVPMPQNTSQLPPSVPALLPEISAGLSSFLDFEAHASSQNSDDLTEGAAPQNEDSDDRKDPEHTAESDEETRRKRIMDEKAAELRTRLQLALYKVQTNQAARPFSRLKKVETERRSASPHHSQTSTNTPQLTSSSTLVPSSANTSMATHHNDSAEHEIYTRRAQATAQMRSAVRSLDALPQPHIVPTAYSSRWAQLQRQDSDGQLPSSPPLSRSPSASSCKIDPALTDLESQLPVPLPTSQRYDQLSSPPVSPNKLRAEHRLKTPAAKGLEAGPTSSTIKGEAANVLLQLTRGGHSTRDR